MGWVRLSGRPMPRSTGTLIVSELRAGVGLLKSETPLYSPPRSAATFDSK